MIRLLLYLGLHCLSRAFWQVNYKIMFEILEHNQAKKMSCFQKHLSIFKGLKVDQFFLMQNTTKIEKNLRCPKIL